MTIFLDNVIPEITTILHPPTRHKYQNLGSESENHLGCGDRVLEVFTESPNKRKRNKRKKKNEVHKDVPFDLDRLQPIKGRTTSHTDSILRPSEINRLKRLLSKTTLVSRDYIKF